MKSGHLNATVLGVTLASALGFTVACGSAEEPHSHLHGFADMSRRWADTRISVCFEDTSEATVNERRWIKEAVMNEITAKTSILFEGWQGCPGAGETVPSQLIRVSLANEWPNAKFLGRDLHNVPSGITIARFYDGFRNSRGELSFKSCVNSEAERETCVRNIAVHEFGHGIGMAHEQNRHDTNRDECTEAPQGGSGDTPVGFWDADSLMNYCNVLWNNGGKLSIKDQHTILTMYPLDNLEYRGKFQILMRAARMNDQERAALGVKLDDGVAVGDSIGVIARYQHGVIVWSYGRTPVLLYGDILRRFEEMGGIASVGYPLSDELATSGGGGRLNHFEGGTMVWSPNTGARFLSARTYNAWIGNGGETSLGFPTTDVMMTIDGSAQFADFSKSASVYVMSRTFSVPVVGGFLREWRRLGAELSVLGLPVGVQYRTLTEARQQFARGVLVFDRLTNQYRVEQ